MPSLGPLWRFLALFSVTYGVLIAPWPGGNAAYAAAFRGFGQAFIGRSAPTIVRFRATPNGGPLDTQIVVIDPAAADAQGRVRARLLGVDSRGVGWIPTAFLCALILASPVPWPRRLRALALGWAALYLYLLLALRVYLWNEMLQKPPAALKAIASGLEETLVTQLGPSFVVPAIVWLLVTFRQADFEAAFAWIARTGDRTRSGP